VPWFRISYTTQSVSLYDSAHPNIPDKKGKKKERRETTKTNERRRRETTKTKENRRHFEEMEANGCENKITFSPY
jgi:hypothetical protein